MKTQILRSKNVTTLSEFNYGEVKWDQLEARGKMHWEVDTWN